MKAIFEFEAPKSCAACKVVVQESKFERWCPITKIHFRIDNSELAGIRAADCPLKFIKGSVHSSNVPTVEKITEHPLRWKTVYDDWGNYYACPRCDRTTHGIDYKFCPYCGIELWPPVGGG